MHFLRLKGMCMDEGKRHLFDKAAKLFADRYGLLGLVHEHFAPHLAPGPRGL